MTASRSPVSAAPSPADGWDAAGYARHAAFVAELGEPLIDLLAPTPGEAILDLGCGDGALTAKLVATGATVVGIDSSPDMVAAARRRGLDARVMDGQAMAFEAAFDGVFSNAALHWMTRPDAVLAGVHRALRPGGRFVGEFGGAGNVGRIIAGIGAVHRRRAAGRLLAEPWYFPSVADYTRRLEAAGFEVSRAWLIDRPTVLPTGLAGWLETFGRSFLGGLSREETADFIAEVESETAGTLRGADGVWRADYVRLRFVAAKPL